MLSTFVDAHFYSCSSNEKRKRKSKRAGNSWLKCVDIINCLHIVCSFANFFHANNKIALNDRPSTANRICAVIKISMFVKFKWPHVWMSQKKTNRLSIIVVVVVVVRELKQINGQCVLSHTSRSEPSECLYINFHNRHILKWASNVILLTDDKSHRSCECGERSFVIKKIFLFYNVWRWKSANEQNSLKQTKIWIIFFCRWDSIVSFAQNKTENIHDNKKKNITIDVNIFFD